MNDPNPHIQLFSTKKISKPMGTDNINAVNKESCRGEIFLVETMLASYGFRDTGCRFKAL